jgi:hypothetical protein
MGSNNSNNSRTVLFSNRDETTGEAGPFLPIFKEDILEIPLASGLFKSILRVLISSEHNILANRA